LELDVVVEEERGLPVPAVVLPEIALFRLPVGAPKEARLWVACKIPEAAPCGICCALFCEEAEGEEDEDGWRWKGISDASSSSG
jgi:hypothetical protein